MVNWRGFALFIVKILVSLLDLIEKLVLKAHRWLKKNVKSD